MLRELRVSNFAIIDRLALRLGPGLNVLTGETGAGKSILIGALGIALGERASSEMIKSGSATATVEACFDTEKEASDVLEGLGIGREGEIILRRDVSAQGKGRAYVNDTMVSVQGLSAVGKTLVDIHGQHEHQSLLLAENQMRILDLYGGLEAERQSLAGLFSKATGLKKRLEDLSLSERERAQRLDLLRYQLNEIESASIRPGEDAALEEEKNLLSNMRKLAELAEAAYMDIYGSEGSSIEKLSSAVSKLRETASIDGAASGPLDSLLSALPLMEDAAATLRGFRDRYDLDPSRLDEVEDRVHLIKNLKKKYGDTLEAVLDYWDRIKSDLVGLEASEEDKEALIKGLQAVEEELSRAASALSEKRRKAASVIERAIVPVLRDLAMPRAEFRVDIKEKTVSSDGMDSVEFLFSANPGEPPKPLSKVASGGELSRIMLSVKGVLREADGIPVLIFDEVDAGIGGRTADNVARKLKEISAGRQVVCITHLPQIASLADLHLLIEKKETKAGVNVIIKELKGDERREEVARMLSGSVTDVSLTHADELIRRGP